MVTILLMVRLLAERYHRALSHWEYYALCSQSLSSYFVVSATAPAFALLTRQESLCPSEIPIQRFKEKRVLSPRKDVPNNQSYIVSAS